VAGAYAFSWVAGGGTVEPHTKVADHVRRYDGAAVALDVYARSIELAAIPQRLREERTLSSDEDAVLTSTSGMRPSKRTTRDFWRTARR